MPGGLLVAGMPGAAPLPGGAVHARVPALPKNTRPKADVLS